MFVRQMQNKRNFRLILHCTELLKINSTFMQKLLSANSSFALAVFNVLKINLLTIVSFVVFCGKAKKGKADANASKAPLRHFVPPPPQRGEELSPFGPFLPFLGVIKFLCAGISLFVPLGTKGYFY